jgi:hypothetical protein
LFETRFTVFNGLLNSLTKGEMAMRRFLFTVAALSGVLNGQLTAVSAALPLQSNTLYVHSFEYNSRLYTVSPATAATTFVGALGTECTDIAFNGPKLAGISFTRFFQINPTTGAVSSLRYHGFSDLNALVHAGAASSGHFFAAGVNGSGTNGGVFVRINATTGAGTLIGRMGNGLTSAGDLTFLNGTLYALVNKPGSSTTWLAKINPTNGKATLVGNTGYSNVWGLEVRSGVMFAMTNNGRTMRLNPVTGISEVVGANTLRMGGLAKSP